MMLPIDKTIAAIATPIGEGGVAMIRISGQRAFEVGSAIFSISLATIPSHQLTYGKIVSADGETIDHVMLAKLQSPRSFTGLDTVEITCHGSMIIQKKILTRCIEAGATLALPGEFSYQAFLSGKIDLAQAEAIQRLIGAKNELALKAAEDQLQGRLSKLITHYRKELIEAAAIIDAWVDYPEEGLEFKTQEELTLDLKKVLRDLKELERTFEEGRKLDTAIQLCLMGAPNAGKSSLMNALLGYDRAIVSPYAGTTRDMLKEDVKMGEAHFSLIDTAGIRDSQDGIEQEGIKRSYAASKAADLILYVIDASCELTDEEKKRIESLPIDKTILIYNKADLCHPKIPFPLFSTCVLSAKTLDGVEKLKSIIEEKIFAGTLHDKGEVVITQKRHQEALSDAIVNLETVICGLNSGVSAEFISFDLKMSLKALGMIIGFDLSESVLDAIFSKFCVGK